MSIKCAFLFPGQGSQAVGMGRDFFENSKIARDLFEKAKQKTNIDFEELLFKENEKLEQTEFTQPAIFLVSMIANRLFQEELNLTPVFALGHSLGEFSALSSVGALDILDGVELVNLRGKLMAQACENQNVGMMVVLGLKDEIVEELTKKLRDEGKKVWAVNYNADGQIVVAGIKDDLKELEPLLKEAGAKRAMLLNMSVASHCPLLESATTPLKEALEEKIKDNFLAPVISNVTAKKYDTKAEALELLPKQLTSAVLYKQSIASFDDEVDCYIEFGHGKVLKGLNKRATKKPHYNVFDMKSLQESIKAIKEMA
jgi:[acyl-carrier-protein] S-malonyltransferase